MQSALIFDLDGTLVDSIELILQSARHAYIGYPGRVPSDAEWRAGIGRPLVTMFREFGADEPEVERLVARYREYQVANHDRLVRAYDGIIPFIQAMHAAGHPMALATSKSDWMAKRALDHVGLSEAIPVIVGAESCNNHKPHPEPVERALALVGATPDNAVFIGDSPHDIESGRAAGVHTIGVTWGAFSREEMERAGADVVVHDVEGMRRAIEAFERG